MRFAANLTKGTRHMAEERVTETHTPEGATHTHTTIIEDGGRSGGGAGWVIALLILVAIVVGVWAFTQWGGSEANKNNAIANAANQVGDAAQQAGDAAQTAANNSAK
jgi:uncharacterized protein HemX